MSGKDYPERCQGLVVGVVVAAQYLEYIQSKTFATIQVDS